MQMQKPAPGPGSAPNLLLDLSEPTRDELAHRQRLARRRRRKEAACAQCNRFLYSGLFRALLFWTFMSCALAGIVMGSVALGYMNNADECPRPAGWIVLWFLVPILTTLPIMWLLRCAGERTPMISTAFGYAKSPPRTRTEYLEREYVERYELEDGGGERGPCMSLGYFLVLNLIAFYYFACVAGVVTAAGGLMPRHHHAEAQDTPPDTYCDDVELYSGRLLVAAQCVAALGMALFLGLRVLQETMPPYPGAAADDDDADDDDLDF